jgi:hypothetical protein
MRGMTKLPEFLRLRLALRQDRPGDHPSAGLLAGFVEQTLPARERADLLEHLAHCAECREVLAAASIPDVSKAPRITWWKWRWATAAAAAVLVAALFWRPDSFRNQSLNTTPLAPAAPSAPAARKTEEPKAAKASSGELAKKRNAKKQTGSQRDATKQFIAQAELPPPPKSAIAQPEPAPALPEIANAPPSKSVPLPPEPPSSAIEPPQDRTRLEGQNMMFRSGLRAGAAKALTRHTLRPERGKSLWNLDGALRKSDDGGKTWHTVQVDDRARLYALSAAGSNVWVGGANGVLFHSVDDGLEWKPVIVAGDDGRLTETITRIETRDENSVRLKTRTGDWLTMDGGVHWRRE